MIGIGITPVRAQTIYGLPVDIYLTTYANSTKVYANKTKFANALSLVEQSLIALDPSTTVYRVDYGTGPNTATGDTVTAALVKLQNWIASIEVNGVTRAFFSDPFFADGMFSRK